MKIQPLQLCFIVLFVLFISGLNAQTMYVRKTNNTQSDYVLANIRKMTFSSGNLVVSQVGGATNSYTLNDLRHINFNNFNLALINQVVPSLGILIYPNPVTDILHFSKLEQNMSSIEIISMEGRVLLQSKQIIKDNATLDVSKLAKGLYLCKINTGTTTQTTKLIKQ